MQTSISTGNMKIGKTANVSISPIKGCRKDVPCSTKCYAMKAYRCYPSARKAWDNNLLLARTQPEVFFGDIREYLSKKQPDYFRWHVAGDILNQNYLEEMKRIAKEYPNTQFRCFTKRFDLDYSKMPKNLCIGFSMWPGMAVPKKLRPRFWVQDGTETRIPKNAKECTGSCIECRYCWDQKLDVWCHIH